MITWTINYMCVNLNEAGYTDVVYLVDWLVSATDGTNIAQEGGATNIPAPTDSFTPYNQLTNEQVLNWVWEALKNQKDLIENRLKEQIAYMQIPPVATLPLPWGN